MENRRPAVVLLSGGLDSTTVLAIARSQDFSLFALSFSYGQRHSVELDSARRIASLFGATQHLVLDVDLRSIGGSALTSDIDVPLLRSIAEMSDGIPATYVP